MNAEFFEKGLDKSEYNEAVNFLNRLNNCWYDLALAKYDKDIDKYSCCLDIIFAELSNDMKDKEKEQKYILLKEIIDEVNKINSTQQYSSSYQFSRTLWWKLHDMELWLRKIYSDAGYQTRRSDDAHKALR
jgi:hypothetical protein